ncbi:MAG: hypothetical protein HY332_12600 [Chloroflexi bacterium]|nr:hypothetical protein [Chloroflexota bacterium]
MSTLWRRAAVAALALLALVLVVALAGRTSTFLGWRAPTRLPHGTVVLLQGTPYYWVADEAGVLHWANDTRALVGRYAKWDRVREVTAAELERLTRGEPWRYFYVWSLPDDPMAVEGQLLRRDGGG